MAVATPAPVATVVVPAEPLAPLATPTPEATPAKPETAYTPAIPFKGQLAPETHYVAPVGYVSEVLKKSVDGVTVEGRLLKPEHPRGAVLLLPTWWGREEGISIAATEIAGWNYETLLLDLYGGKSPTSRAEAARLSHAMDQAQMMRVLKASVTALSEATTRPLPVAIVGWEWGGTLGLRLAMDDHRAKALAVIDAQPPADPARLKLVACPILSIFSIRGGMVSNEEISAFVSALKQTGVNHPATLKFTTPPGSLLKPTSRMEQAYSQTARERLREFLDRTLVNE